MALPNQFSPVEHFQDNARKVYNRDVKDWFSDLGDENWNPTIGTPRGSLRVACTHREDDSVDLTVGRMLLFEATIRQRYTDRNVGTTIQSPNVIRRTRPKVRLYFLEDYADVDPDYEPVAGEIGFRLMNETTAGLSEANALALANKIRTAFASGPGFVWRKGRIMCAYSDWERGYQLQILARTKAEGKRVIEQVLDIQSHSPDWENLSVGENDQPSSAYPIVPPTERILGKTRKLPRRRPSADVRFQYATLHLAGVNNPYCLVDRSLSFPNPLVRA